MMLDTATSRRSVATVWLLAITAGIVSSQDNFSCGPVCLLAEWSCFCELTINNVLAWSLKNLAMQQVGVGATFVVGSASPGTLFAGGHFIATVTDPLEGAIASVTTGTVNQTIAGYFLQCLDVISITVVGSEEISIPDEPSQPENLTATTDPSTGSVLLSWTPPINNSQCVVGYIINSTLPNSTVSISNTLNHTLFPVGGVNSSCTYSASVAANDTAGRIGNWSQVLFSFNGSSSIISDYPSQITELRLSYISNSTVNISWNVSSDLLLECIDFIISTNASAPSSTTNSSVLITRPVEDPPDAIYTVSIAAMDKEGRTGEQSETLCFSFESPRILEVHANNAHGTTITIQWTVKLSQCLPSVTNYFITVINDISSVIINTTNTNETMYTLPDVHVGDVYVIEIVPSSALGNGSAAATTISITPTISSPFQSSTSISAPTCLCENGADHLVIGNAVAIAVIVVLIIMLVSSLIANFILFKKRGNHLSSDSKNEKPKSEYATTQDTDHAAQEQAPKVPVCQEIDQLNDQEHHGANLDSGEDISTAQNTAYSTVLQQSSVVTVSNPAYSSCVKEPVYDDVIQ